MSFKIKRKTPEPKLQPEEPKEPEKIVIQSFDELSKLVAEPVYALVPIGGRAVKIPCVRLTPKQSYELELMLKSCLPPRKKDEKGDTYFDTDDEKYQQDKDRKRMEVRCLAAYWGCPLYQERKPGLKNVNEIVELVQSSFSDNTMRAIATAVMEGDPDEWERRVQFF